MAAVENSGTRMCPQTTQAMEKGKETNQWVSVPMVASIQSCQTAAIQSTLTTLCIMTQDGIDLFLIEKTFPVPTDAFTFKEIVLHSKMTTMVCIGKAEC